MEFIVDMPTHWRVDDTEQQNQIIPRNRVFLLCGAKNSGKTTQVQRMLQNASNADGLISPKVFSGKKHIGYDLVHFQTKECVPLARSFASLSATWKEQVRQGKWSFSEEAFCFAKKTIEKMVQRNASTLFLDEVGKLECMEKGFASLFTILQESKKDIFLVVRKKYAKEIAQLWNTKNYYGGKG